MKKSELKAFFEKSIKEANNQYEDKIEELTKAGVKKLPLPPNQRIYAIGYETAVDINKFDDRETVLQMKENSNKWVLNWFDEMDIKSVIAHGNLGYSRKELVFKDKAGKIIDVDKSLAKLQKDGYIIILNDPKKIKQAKASKKSEETEKKSGPGRPKSTQK